jgi:signal transduction histidine kinase
MPLEEAMAQLASGKVVSALTRQLRKDGRPLLIQLVSAALTDEAGQVAGYVSVHRDVTEQEALRARLAQTDRLAILGTLAASVGHEINNPLAFVTGNLELLLEQEDRAELREMAADALSGAGRIRHIVNDLKALTRAEVSPVQELDVRRVVESAVGMASNQIRHSARLEQHLEPAPNVVGNESRLWQVVLNLLVNAAQAIPPEGDGERYVSVSTYGLPPVQGGAPGGTAVIEVKDTGVGIPAELLPHVFDPFFTTQPIGHGTGLGLAICHGFVTAMGGTIEVESKLGHGTTVRVRLPGVPV